MSGSTGRRGTRLGAPVLDGLWGRGWAYALMSPCRLTHHPQALLSASPMFGSSFFLVQSCSTAAVPALHPRLSTEWPQLSSALRPM